MWPPLARADEAGASDDYDEGDDADHDDEHDDSFEPT